MRVMQQNIFQYNGSFWSKILRTLFTVMLVGGISQGFVEAAVMASGQNSENSTSSSAHLAHNNNTRMLLGIAGSAPSGSFNSQQRKKGTVQHALPFSRETVKIILLGGLFVLIGTFFIPHMLPHLSSYQAKLMHILEQAAKIYRTLFQMPQHHFAGTSAMVEMQAVPAFQRPVAAPIPLKRRKPVYPRPGDRILISTPKRRRQPSSPTGVIEAFFQQSGFVVKPLSESELIISSQLARYKQYGDIPVYVMNNTVVDQRHIQTIQIRQKKQRRPHALAFIIVNTPLEESAYQEIYHCKVTDNFTIIPLSHLLVAKSVRHASCAQQLEEKMSASTGLSNLYAMNTPVGDPLNFFGRTKIMNQLLNAVGQQQQIAVFGAPKIGKTWLFWQLKERLSAHITIYVDLQQLPKSSSYLYRKIIDECARDIGFKYPDLEVPQLHLSWTGATENDAQKFSHDLITLWQHVQQKQADTQIILLLDGAEHLLPGAENAQKTENTLSTFMMVVQEIIAQHRCLTSILAFASPQAFRVPFPKSWRCERKIALSSLTEEQCNGMITSLGAQMGLQYSEESLSRLYFETGGHPYVTRQVCSLIAKNLRRSKMIPLTLSMDEYIAVQVRDVEQAVSEYLEYKSEYLEEFWQQLFSPEQDALRMIASQNSCTRDELMQRIRANGVHGQRHQALQCLTANDLIEKCEGKYAIKMELFERIVLTH